MILASPIAFPPDWRERLTRSSINAYGYARGYAAFGDVYDDAITELTAVLKQVDKQIEEKDHFYTRTPATTISAWKTARNTSGAALALLKQDADAARKNTPGPLGVPMRNKWIGTARAAMAALKEAKLQANDDWLTNLGNAIEVASKEMVGAALDMTGKLAGGLGLGALKALVASPVFWIAAAAGTAYLFRGRIARKIRGAAA